MIYDWDDLEGSGGIRSGLSGRKVDLIERFFARSSRAIVASSQELEKFIHQVYPSHAPIKVGPCGVDLDQFNPDRIEPNRIAVWKDKLGLRGKKVVLYHGQLEMGDPGTVLLEALTRIKTTMPFKLLIVGGGAVQQRIIEQASRIGLADRIAATGYVPFEEIPVLLALADVAVALFPDDAYSRCKSPLKLYEAMAMGVPLIATRIGQATEVLPDCGVLIPPGDAESLENALLQLLENPEQARQLGQKAHGQALARHSWKSLAETFLALYRQAAGG